MMEQAMEQDGTSRGTRWNKPWNKMEHGKKMPWNKYGTNFE
jgi:hypothetical protein